MKGKFIVIDGPDGSGKSTLIRGLTDYLEQREIPYIQVREPGSTPLGEELRDKLLSLEHVAPKTEALLFAAARAQLVEEKIRPALAEGKFVICDRYVLSSVAYQGAGRGLGEEAIYRLNTWATDDLCPNLTLLLGINPEEGLARQAKKRELDRMEAAGNEFHKRVAEAYEKGVLAFPQQRILPLDGMAPKEEVLARAIRAIEPMLGVTMKDPTKLIVAIVQDQDVPLLLDDLIQAGYRVTRLATTGGFLKAGNTTLLSGVHEDDVPAVLSIIENNCKIREVRTTMLSGPVPGDVFMPYPVDVRIGGATVFVLNIADFMQF